MSSVPYPPWTAPSILERDHENKSKWKKAFQKPWFRRSGHKKKAKSSPQKELETMEDRFSINPFAPRNLFHGFNSPLAASPLGNYTPGASRRPQTEPSSSEDDQSHGMFDPDVLIGKTNRPALADVLPLFENHKLQKASTKPYKPPPLITTEPPPITPGRRHSIDSPARPKDITPIRLERVSTSSDSSSDPRFNRRERRAGALRVLPILPNIQQPARSNIYCSPYKQPYYNQYISSQGLANSFSFPPWPQPHEQLQELEEELEEEDIDGMEMVHDEQRERLHKDEQYRAEGLVQQQARGQEHHLKVEWSKEKDRKMKAEKKTANKLNHQKDESSDIKGFDSFMMY